MLWGYAALGLSRITGRVIPGCSKKRSIYQSSHLKAPGVKTAWATKSSVRTIQRPFDLSSLIAGSSSASGFPGRQPGIIVLISPIIPMSRIPHLQPCTGHAFAQAAVFKKRLLQTLQLTVKQVVCLMYKADGDIRHNFTRASFRELPKGLECQGRCHAQLSSVSGLATLFVLNAKISHAQEIPIILQQLFQARSCHIGQLDLGLLGSCRGFASFYDVLFAGA
jgi:hypothetical protein